MPTLRTRQVAPGLPHPALPSHQNWEMQSLPGKQAGRVGDVDTEPAQGSSRWSKEEGGSGDCG